jgi:hypothetical protein
MAPVRREKGGNGSIATWVRNRTWSASKILAARSSVMPKYSFRSSRQKMAPREWSATKAQFAVVFDDRLEVSR